MITKPNQTRGDDDEVVFGKRVENYNADSITGHGKVGLSN
jgi:hypothetical protein